MKISVIIPSFRRPAQLAVCLEAVKRQARPPDEVIVVVRDTDGITRDFLEGFNPGGLNFIPVQVARPGVVAALGAGAERSRGDILAVTDDDAEPLPNWIRDMERHFLDPSVGGVGGRDLICRGGIPSERCIEPVGLVTWYGRIIGNHHWGCGKARDVDVLKGVNMGFRRHLFVLDENLLGGGAQIFFEVGLCLRARNMGWRLIYDPGMVVRHYPAERFDEDQRDRVNPVSTHNNAHNEVCVLLKNLPAPGKPAFLFYTFLVGTRGCPGLAAGVWALVHYGPGRGAELVRASLGGKLAAVRKYYK